ncbi:MAG: glycosyltransferase [Marinobacter sp.]|uniref:glycosyltransferase family 2 protein n=1 Tax=Marinobacter sp. TaxID=50741 RepID=UPI00396E3715
MELSVVVPAYNASESIGSTLNAVLDVEGVELEVIVVDDGSTDELSIVIEHFVKDSRVSLIRQKNSGGPASPRNKGVAASSGEYILFLDADDIVISEEIEAVLHALSRNPESVMICSNFHVADENLDIRIERNIDRYETLQVLITKPVAPNTWQLSSEDALATLLQTNFVGTSSVIARRSALEAAGPFDESLRNLDDRDMWIRLAQLGPILYRDKPFYLYRDTPGSVSKQRELQQFRERVVVAEKVLRSSESPRIRSLAKAWRARSLLKIGYILFHNEARPNAALGAFAWSFVSEPSGAALRGVLKSLLPPRVYRMVKLRAGQRGR